MNEMKTMCNLMMGFYVEHQSTKRSACNCLYFRDETGQYVLKDGHDRELRLYVRVKNSGEDAHETVVTLMMPSFLEYRGVDSAVSKLSTFSCCHVTICLRLNQLPML